jgi:hypothetical protein
MSSSNEQNMSWVRAVEINGCCLAGVDPDVGLQILVIDSLSVGRLLKLFMMIDVVSTSNQLFIIHNSSSQFVNTIISFKNTVHPLLSDAL